ncbi:MULTISPECIES: 23S rRNA (adenine(2503)-C(2))-methyltransferase RlmN [Kosmotoga]|jgi:23S rRNA (adenine2503-C2)-methyltransferase|uniref:Probable dual-specificity RNA methyltransferase RlmN n=1 Tax=Kosmotoga olearia (strain ATCC BAA-1733 / DSM 21960 / TBF 19.5.1) TaxID=521045 RepID=C5CGV5_KOSOT|nr:MULTISPECIES: 23S rRNA (adenine(2503)-C(2))-methyltransferase RlmN [Kosmotoga]ACR80624.1 radical SAM enzyme, Cfr family [Kosmotoga olearia TBF 19.5.1]MDI3523246.1 rRNA (adenine2503-C2)-methyltransferase [Kosmotoga sp.]MDK2952825.1 rRNA (adenine2503-C2)-methyltransferase [Kosmotoga sp.]OAA19490.1 50S rRNA methyltransferase [Kosmotoga sp. DU53]
MQLLEMTLDELRKVLVDEGYEKYRASQIFDWIYKKKVLNFSNMTNLPKDFRKFLSGTFRYPEMTIVRRSLSKIDGTEKFLWKLHDGEFIESVILRHPDHTTFCISTQVGCQLGCIFCATGMSGFKRNLSVSEIVGQVIFMEKSMGKNVTNIVFMGMGEPFLNTDNVFKSIEILHEPAGRNLGIRHFTISTAGIPEGIIRLADSGMDVRLSLSLHAATDEKRSMLMPINKRYNIQQLMASLEYYQRKTNRRITIEYILIDGINDSIEDAKQLAKLFKHLKIFVNIIAINPVVPTLKRPSREKVERFAIELKKHGIEAAIRTEKGSDIDAACGQLRRKNLQEERA